MVPWSSTDTRAARGSVYPDMAADQGHLPMAIICDEFGGGRGRRYYHNQRNTKRQSCCCCCCCISDCRTSPSSIMSLAITPFFGVAGKPGVCRCISSPMWTKHWMVKIMSASISGCVHPVNIPRRGDSGLFPKISFERFFPEGFCKYGFDTLDGVQRFRFKNTTRYSSKIKPIRSGSTVAVVLVHSNKLIYEGTEGYQIR